MIFTALRSRASHVYTCDNKVSTSKKKIVQRILVNAEYKIGSLELVQTFSFWKKSSGLLPDAQEQTVFFVRVFLLVARQQVSVRSEITLDGCLRTKR